MCYKKLYPIKQCELRTKKKFWTKRIGKHIQLQEKFNIIIFELNFEVNSTTKIQKNKITKKFVGI